MITRLLLLAGAATALQLQPRRDYIRGFNSAAPRACAPSTVDGLAAGTCRYEEGTQREWQCLYAASPSLGPH